jgi:hypothetical protein
MSNQQKREKLTEEEILKAVTQVAYFINKYCKIEASGKGLVPFTLYPYQIKVLSVYLKNPRVIDLKSRQMGFTTLAAAYALWKSLRKGNNILFLSKKEDDAMDMLRKVKIMYDNLPPELQHAVESKNATTIEFVNKNRIQSLPATDRAGAGKSASLVIMDEFSAFPAASGQLAGDDVWMSIIPTMSTGGQVIVQSTPKGMGNKFYDIWAGDNNFYKHECLWWEHPVYGKDLEERDCGLYGNKWSPWAEGMISAMTPDGWAQEFNGDFVTSGRPVFDHRTLIQTEITPEDKDYGNHYVCGVDIASGSSTDFSVAQFICVETGRQVESFRSKDPVDVFAATVIRKCRQYNNAYLAFENNSGYGLSFMKEAKQYPNMYYQRSYDKRTEKRTRKLGWNTNTKTKELMINDLQIALINQGVKLTDKQTISELKAYQYDENDRMNARAGMNDDTVTSLAIAYQAMKSYHIDDSVIKYNHQRIGNLAPTVEYGGMIPVDPEVFYQEEEVDWRVV